eukprot:PRCOL_00004368-RA
MWRRPSSFPGDADAGAGAEQERAGVAPSRRAWLLKGAAGASIGAGVAPPARVGGARPASAAPAPVGIAALQDPRANDGLATAASVRAARKLEGLLPAGSATLDVEVDRLMATVRASSTPLEAYRQLVAAKETSERAFYAALVRNTDELLPLLYTPTVGEACQRFSTLIPRPRGLYVSAADAGRVASVVASWPEAAVRIAVMTDGERILGLGDQGAGGMGIAVGKCMVYCAAGGIAPPNLLPVCVDVGTDNQQLLDDPLYIGLRQKRLRGQAYDDLMDELTQALRKRYGQSLLLHFEDFGGSNAFRLLSRYSPLGAALNDDIQSTAVVIVAALRSAERLRGAAPLASSNVLFFGAGQANLGGAELLAATIAADEVARGGGSDAEREEAEARVRSRLWLVDRKGLLTADRPDLAAGAGADPRKLRFAHARPAGLAAGAEGDLAAVVRALRPAALVGATGATPGAFESSGALKEMGKVVDAPVILALSNPTNLSECTARQALDATGGRAIFAAGSPFDELAPRAGAPPVQPAFANNALVFPGIGLGVAVSGAARITTPMLVAAANGLASATSEAELAARNVLPTKGRARDAALRWSPEDGAL